jgi:hypothetical protein
LKHATPLGHLVLRLATLCVAAAVSLSAAAKELSFEQAFSVKGEPHSLHYQAVFTSQGAEHQLEVWRDGDRRLKRRTDEAIETYAVRKPGDTEFHMSILDRKKRIHTRIDRSNLYRIGNFTDWFDLAHGLKHPRGEYRVAKAQAPDGAAKAITPCQWYGLTQDGRTTHICWSAQNHLPLVIQAQNGDVLWRVAALDRNQIPAKTFEIHDEGFVRNDANQDIERD